MLKFVILAVLVLVFCVVFAEVPRMISYQGRLADASGNPITGTRDITFKLYTAETGGSPIWTETHNNVSISNGLYNVMLGSVSAFPPSVDFSEQYWLGVTIGTDPEMTPRYKLGASPYALGVPSSLNLWTDGGTYIRPNNNQRVRINDADSSNDIYISTNSPSVRHSIYVYTNDGYVGGSGYTPSTARANIAAYDYNAGKYNFALAGWSYLDSSFSAAVFGAKQDVSTYGALAMKIGSDIYAGFFNGKVKINNSVSSSPGLFVSSKTGSTSETWNTISSKGSGVVLSVAADSSVHNDGVLLLTEKGTGTNRYFLRADSWYGGWHWVDMILPSGELEIQADSTAKRGVYIHNSSAGVADTGIVIRNAEKMGIYIDSVGPSTISEPELHFGIKIRKTEGGMFVERTSYTGVLTSNTGAAGFYSHKAGSSGVGVDSSFGVGVLVNEPGLHGVYITKSDYPNGRYGIYSYSAAYASDTVGYFYGHIRVRGNVYSGAHMRVIPGEDGDGIVTPEITATAHWIEHIGEAHLSGGTCRVDLPADFVDGTTIDEMHPMQVFLTPYGDLGRYTIERGKNYFVVRQIDGNPNAAFAYRVVARARGSEDETSYRVNLKAEDEMNSKEAKEHLFVTRKAEN